MSILPKAGRRVAILGVSMGVSMLGCLGADPEAAAGAAAGLRFCEDPRPEACTREYRPVCGHRCAGPPCREAERKSYGNACDACADASVVAHRDGRCERPPPDPPPTLR